MALDWVALRRNLIVILHLIVDRVLELCLGWYLGPHKRCSAPQNAQAALIISKSATELAQLIRERKLKSYDVVKTFYDRILQVNPELNALVDGPFKEALEQAQQIDADLQQQKLTAADLAQKPFLGVPFTTKDSTAVAGRLQTLGLVARKTAVAKEEAECVRLLREHGAIILATTNVPEANMWCETRNNLVGQTCNPYDLRRSVGGSSGGEAAFIAAGCNAFGLGTDIGGSIRIPAFNCGVFGHKPSMGVINTRGCTFRTGKETQTMVVAGPMTRFACDLKPLLLAMCVPEMKPVLKLEEAVDLKKIKYFYVDSNEMPQCNLVNTAMQQAMLKVRQHFQSLTGQQVQLAQLPSIEFSGKLWRYWMTQEPSNVKLLLGNGVKLNPFFELFKKLLGQSDLTMAAIYSLIDSVLPKEKEQLMRKATVKCKTALEALLGDNGVLFYHSAPRTAPFHFYPLIKFSDFAYFSIFNVLKVPVTQVPMGLDATSKMPLGVQVVTTDKNDRLTLAVAEELERAFGGWVPPYGGTLN